MATGSIDDMSTGTIDLRTTWYSDRYYDLLYNKYSIVTCIIIIILYMLKMGYIWYMSLLFEQSINRGSDGRTLEGIDRKRSIVSQVCDLDIMTRTVQWRKDYISDNEKRVGKGLFLIRIKWPFPIGIYCSISLNQGFFITDRWVPELDNKKRKMMEKF